MRTQARLKKPPFRRSTDRKDDLLVLFCHNHAQTSALLKEFMAAVEEIPGSTCLRSRQPTFPFTSNRRQDKYCTYSLSALETAFLLDQGRIPNPGNGGWTNVCGRSDCVNTTHWERIPQSHVRASRIDRATSPDDFFPALMLKPMSPRGHARCGDRNPVSSISEETAAEVLRLRYCAGHTYRFISEQMGLKQAAIYSICAGNSHRLTAQALLPDLIAGARQNGLLPAEPEPVACADAH
jgi:hypothetical protein